MHELRFTDTNAADDSRGRAFGLEGNLYLPLVVALVGSFGVAAFFGLVMQTSWKVASAMGLSPLAVVAGWIVLLKHGKPAGYDIDQAEAWLGRGHFSRNPAAQEGLE